MEKTNNSSTNSAGPSSSSNTGPPRATKKSARQKDVDNITKKFLRNFNPECSEREKRKLRRRFQTNKKSMYDEKGMFMPTYRNVCDCLNVDCAGCHFPCPKCCSTKCAHECRSNRKWAYESIHYEGSETVIINTLLGEK